MKLYLKVISAGLLVSATGTAAVAQTSGSAANRPTPIGTSQETADKANAEAIKRGDTATVVRTGPSAADKVSNATSATKDKVGDAARTGTHEARKAAKHTKHDEHDADNVKAKTKLNANGETTRP